MPALAQQGNRPAASYHADSQATRLHDTAGLVAHAEAHAEPSINQGGHGGGNAAALASVAGSRGAGGAQEEVRSTVSAGAGPPADFFDNHASVVGSAGPGPAAAPAAALPAEQAVSIEGSTGAGAAAGAPAGGEVTSPGSRREAAGGTGASGVPAGFFDHSPAAADSVVGPPSGAADGGTVVSSKPAAAAAAEGEAGAAPLPKGALWLWVSVAACCKATACRSAWLMLLQQTVPAAVAVGCAHACGCSTGCA